MQPSIAAAGQCVGLAQGQQRQIGLEPKDVEQAPLKHEAKAGKENELKLDVPQ